MIFEGDQLAAMGFIVAIFILGALAALGAAHGATGGRTSLMRHALLVLLSLVLSVIVLIAGGVPFYILEKAASVPGGGAPFIFLIWMGIGPIVAFVVVPGIYAMISPAPTRGKFFKFGFPAVVSGLGTIAAATGIYSDVSGGATEMVPAEIAAFVVFIAAAFGTWLMYLTVMDRAGAHTKPWTQ